MDSFRSTPFLIGIAGCPASGKSTLSNSLYSKLSKTTPTTQITMDSFYVDIPANYKREDINFDEPSSLHFDDFLTCLHALINNQKCEFPIYSFELNKRLNETITVIPRKIIIITGVYLFYDERIRNLIDLKVFLNTDLDICLLRRIKRDINNYNRTLNGILTIHELQTRPAHFKFLLPTKEFSDMIISLSSTELATELIEKKLNNKNNFSSKLLTNYPNLVALPHSFQVRQLMTLLRDKTTSREDFIFYTNRLSHYIIEYAFGFLPYKPLSITTPLDEPYLGLTSPQNKICGVSLMRGGECMERSLKEVHSSSSIGKILLHFDGTNQNEWNATVNPIPIKIYCKMPQDIQNYFVFVLDPVIGRAKSSQFVVSELLNLGVKEKNISYISLIAYKNGVEELSNKFPEMRVFTIEVDERIDENGFVLPGVGNFSFRYFGC